jgi:AcrR family transcriptional regulator
MPRTGQAYEEIRDRSNRRILDAARRVFAKKGLRATVADIAKEAGVSQGLAYRYFPSKEEIFYTLLREMLDTGGVKFSDESGKTPRERLERFVSETIRMRRENPDLYRFVFQALSEQSLPEDLLHKMEAHGLEVRTVLRRLIVEGQSDEEVARGDPDQLVDVILACLEGLSMRLAYSDPSTRMELPDASIILRLLGPDLSKGERRA